MTHEEFHNELSQLLYIEDPAMYDIILASIAANSMQLADPVWLTLIGPSSGGKSQIIRPFSIGNPGIIHRLDDLTTNSLISGALGLDNSLLGHIGEFGILSMDDLTVLFSKNAEARAEILGQFRMLYDGRFAKSSGNRKEEMVWEGYLGMIAGSTPSIYRFFGEVADMGERFVNYRMKNLDHDKALDFITKNQLSSRDLDQALATLLSTRLQTVLDPTTHRPELLTLSPDIISDLSTSARWFTLLRTPVHIDERSGHVDEFPEPELPLRVMKQLITLGKALQIIYQRQLTPDDLDALLWVGYSLSNDKRRRFLKAAISLEDYGKHITNRNISSVVGLSTDVVGKAMSSLQALNIVELTDDTAGVYKWRLLHHELSKLVRRLDPSEQLQDTIDFEL